MKIDKIEVIQEDIDRAVEIVKQELAGAFVDYFSNCVVGQAVNRQYPREDSGRWVVWGEIFTRGIVPRIAIKLTQEVTDYINAFDMWRIDCQRNEGLVPLPEEIKPVIFTL